MITMSDEKKAAPNRDASQGGGGTEVYVHPYPLLVPDGGARGSSLHMTEHNKRINGNTLTG